MTADNLRAWRYRLRLTQTIAAQRLGLSLRAVQNYESGVRRIPGPVALACDAIATEMGGKIEHE